MAVDLEMDSLPTCLVVDGVDVPVRTSFRAWLRFGRIVEQAHVCDPHVLVGPCDGDWRPAALEFYRSPVETPRTSDVATARPYDLALDGDYVVGSFQAAYGIDLTCGDMHWHRFLALLRSLPKDSKLVEIAGYRTWDESTSKRRPSERYRRLRNEWRLPEPGGPSHDELVSMQRSLFGDVTYEPGDGE